MVSCSTLYAFLLLLKLCQIASGWWLQKKADASAQPIRDYKGQSRQMITMAFLEEGGYFDVPIQVSNDTMPGLG